MGQLHPAAPKLEREQTDKPAPAFLVKGRYNPINGLMLPSHLTISMLRTGGTLAMMKSTSRFRFAHVQGQTRASVSGLPFDPEITSKRTSYFWTNP